MRSYARWTLLLLFHFLTLTAVLLPFLLLYLPRSSKGSLLDRLLLFLFRRLFQNVWLIFRLVLLSRAIRLLLQIIYLRIQNGSVLLRRVFRRHFQIIWLLIYRTPGGLCLMLI